MLVGSLAVELGPATRHPRVSVPAVSHPLGLSPTEVPPREFLLPEAQVPALPAAPSSWGRCPPDGWAAICLRWGPAAKEHSQPWGRALHCLDPRPSTSKGRRGAGRGNRQRSSSSRPSPQPSSSARFRCPSSPSQTQPISRTPSHTVSYPSYLQHPSSSSNASQNCAPHVFLPNPSIHISIS